MSRIGKLPINIPSGVTVTVNGDQVNVHRARKENCRKLLLVELL